MPKAMRLIEKIDLPNGLAVEFYDYSRQVAGDRWLVGLMARVPIEAAARTFASLSNGDAAIEEFLKAKGPIVYFEKKVERNFIDHAEKDRVLTDLLESFKGHCLAYIGHQGFADGFLRRQAKDFLERRAWWK